jgi:hypothetical protein
MNFSCVFLCVLFIRVHGMSRMMMGNREEGEGKGNQIPPETFTSPLSHQRIPLSLI